MLKQVLHKKERGNLLMKKWWIQELLVAAIIAVGVIVVYLFVESGKLHTGGITTGRIHLEYEDKIIDTELFPQDVKTICELLDGVPYAGTDVKTPVNKEMQLTLGDDIHLYICNAYIFYSKERSEYVAISRKAGEKMEKILVRYGYI